MKYSYANNPMLFKMDLQRTLDQYERENEMKRHKPLKIMTYKALPSVPGTERKESNGILGCILVFVAAVVLIYLFVSFLVGIVVLTNWLIC